MIIKVCGMRDGENIREVERAGADWIGLIFYPKSPRYVEALPAYLPSPEKRVGVFVNESLEGIMERVQGYGLGRLQLHGSESPALCQSLRDRGIPVIKAFSIVSGRPFPMDEVEPYEGHCDYYLFDTKTALHGGSGRKYDWKILAEYEGRTPFLLSGGISPEDGEALTAFAHPQWVGIDLNSRFELSPAVKDARLLQPFIRAFRSV